MKVFVYYNLHKKLWSIKALEGVNKGRVIGHRHEVMLRNPVGRVSQAGRLRVLKERRKNVHAGIVGYLLKSDLWLSDMFLEQITYNPYKYDSFVYNWSEEPVDFDNHPIAWLKNKQVHVTSEDV